MTFTEDSTFCTIEDIVSSMTVTPSSGTLFITFDSATNTVSWYSSDVTDVGEYQVTVTAHITAISTFTQ